MEDAYVIRGGKPLRGEVRLSGAKNVALKILIAALLFDEEVTLKNIPRINDVYELLSLMNYLGAKACFTEGNTVVVDSKTMQNNRVDLLHSSKIRVSFMLFAPLLKKFKYCYVPNPGGCRIGARPIDRIIDGMKNLGVKVDYNSETGYYDAVINNKIDGNYTFSKPSHTGTELLIMIALLANHQVVIGNAALEPEIDELIRFLNEGGAKIKREGKRITIDPVGKLHRVDPFTIMSDRNEAVTFASLALATKGDITIYPIPIFLIDSFIKKVKEVGGGVDVIPNDKVRFYYQKELKASHIETSPYPGFMTDWQQNWAIIMVQAQGQSVIHERVFENRFSYIDELKKLGAEIDYYKVPISNPMEYFFFNFDPSKKYNQAIKINGPQKLHNGVLNMTDLRAGATLAIAALIAEGESVVTGASHLERGYEDFMGKVTKLGGDIKKV